MRFKAPQGDPGPRRSLVWATVGGLTCLLVVVAMMRLAPQPDTPDSVVLSLSPAPPDTATIPAAGLPAAAPMAASTPQTPATAVSASPKPRKIRTFPPFSEVVAAAAPKVCNSTAGARTGALARSPYVPAIPQDAAFFGEKQLKAPSTLSKCQWARMCAWAAQPRLPVEVGEGMLPALEYLRNGTGPRRFEDQCEEKSCMERNEALRRGDKTCVLPVFSHEEAQDILSGVHFIVVGDSTGAYAGCLLRGDVCAVATEC